MTIKKDDLFNKENEAQSNWAKFNKVGDRFSGILVGTSDQSEKGIYKAQRVYDLEQEDGSILRIAIPVSKEGTIARANSARMGDTLGFEFSEEISPKEKGLAPAKALKVYIAKKSPESGSDEALAAY